MSRGSTIVVRRGPGRRVKKILRWPKQKPSVDWDKLEKQSTKPWGHVKTAERSASVLQPVNNQARHQLSRTKSRRKAILTTVYLVRLTHIRDRSISFLKIGITTRRSIKRRFERDIGRYSVDVLYTSEPIPPKSARVLESALHNHFCHLRYRPSVPMLSGGNTECFVYDPSTTVSDVYRVAVEALKVSYQ